MAVGLRCACVQVGDGTTSVCLLAGEFLKSIKGYIEDGVHPQTVIKGFRDALKEVRNNKTTMDDNQSNTNRPHTL